jgi:hypothetical protein
MHCLTLAFIQNVVYKDDFLSHGRSKSQNVDFKPLPQHLLL